MSSYNQSAINETMAQFDRQCVYVYFCKESGIFKTNIHVITFWTSKSFAKSIGYDSIEELLHEMNATYRTKKIDKVT